MHSRLSDFIAARAAESYPEPRTGGHDGITAQVAPLVAAHLPPFARVLDVGCGRGPALEWFTEHGFKPTGTTVNEDELREFAHSPHSVYALDMHALSDAFDAETFDCVWARHVLEHSVIPFFALHEFARVLKPGGILYAEMPQPDGPCGHESHNPNHYSVFGFRAWTSLIERAGFEIVEARHINLVTGAGDDVYYSWICRKKNDAQDAEK